MAIYGKKPMAKGYLRALGNLYGQTQVKPPPKRKKAAECPTEEEEQIRLVNWMDDMEIRHFSVPNGRSSSWEGAKYKRTGSVAGVPDICVPYPSKKGHHGLYIELKRQLRGVISPEQQEWIDFLNSQGYYACVAKGFHEAKNVIEWYMEGK